MPLDSTPKFTEIPQISVLAGAPKRFSHKIELFRVIGCALPPIDAHAHEIAAGWKAKIVGVKRYATADEVVHTYWAVNQRRRKNSSTSAE